MPPTDEFTIGELTRAISRIELVLSRIENKVEGRAEKADLDDLKRQVQQIQLSGTREAQDAYAKAIELEKRVGILEHGDAGQSAVQKYKGWLLALAGFLIALAALVLSNTWYVHRP